MDITASPVDVVPVVSVALANDVIVRAIRSLGVHAELEPSRPSSVVTARGPMGATLDPWNGGRYFAWDFTCSGHSGPLTSPIILQWRAGVNSCLGRDQQAHEVCCSLGVGLHLCFYCDRDSRGMGTSCSVSLRRGGGKDRHIDGGHSGWGVPQTSAGHCGPERQCSRCCGYAPT